MIADLTGAAAVDIWGWCFAWCGVVSFGSFFMREFCDTKLDRLVISYISHIPCFCCMFLWDAKNSATYRLRFFVFQPNFNLTFIFKTRYQTRTPNRKWRVITETKANKQTNKKGQEKGNKGKKQQEDENEWDERWKWLMKWGWRRYVRTYLLPL